MTDPTNPPELPSVLDSLFSAGDAETELAASLIDHQLRLSSAGVRAASFLAAYGMPDILREVLRLRRYQSGDKAIVEALSSVALKKFMRNLSINLGNS